MVKFKSIAIVFMFTIFILDSLTSGSKMAAASSPFNQTITEEIEYISSLQMSNGVIRNSKEYGLYDTQGKYYLIQPYNANIAALALLKDPTKLAQVKQYLEWYFKHLNWPDISGLYGTVYDYWIDDQGQEKLVKQKSGDPSYDSVDSYSATFLMLVNAFYDAGGADEKAFILANKYKIDVIGNTIISSIDNRDNLTWAKPGYPAKYLMDNCEAAKGLEDIADLFSKLDDCGGSAWYRVYADRIKAAINNSNGLSDGNWYYPVKFSNGSRSNKILDPIDTIRNSWYPDVSAQFYPILYNVISPTDPKAISIYQTLTKNYHWQDLKVSQFPFVQIGYVGTLMNDSSSVRNFYQNLKDQYITNYNEHKSTWNSWEAGWYVLMVDKILQNHWDD